MEVRPDGVPELRGRRDYSADERHSARRAADAAQAADSESDRETDREPDIDKLNEMLKANGLDPIDDEEYDAFREWCYCQGLDMHEESFCDWQNDSEGGERFYAEREWDQYVSEEESSSPATQVRADTVHCPHPSHLG